jgi:hypothetical protein
VLAEHGADRPTPGARHGGARRTGERIALAVDADGFAPTRRRTVSKWGSTKLGDDIAAKQERRAQQQQTPRTSAAARQRRRLQRLRRGSRG